MANYTLSKETSLFQKDKISTDVTDAGTKATDYITKIDNNGLYVSPKSQSPTSGAEGNSVKINGNGLEVYVGGTSVAKYGTTGRVGTTTDNVSIGSTALSINKAGTEYIRLTTSGLRLGRTSDPSTTPATPTVNNYLTDSGFTIRKGTTTDVASFKVGTVRDGGVDKSATRIEATNEIGIYANGYSSGHRGLVIAKRGGAPVFYFGNALQFCPQPYAHATSTSSNISLSSNTTTSVPMTDISSSHTFMEIDAGCIKFSEYDSIEVEVTASVYVVPSANTQATIYLYRYRGDLGTTDEIAAGSTYLSSYGGAVQLVPRIYSPINWNDKLYIGIRLFSATGTAYCNHKDTFLNVKYI